MLKLMKKNLKLAILGLGQMGQNHLRNLNMLKGVEICWLYDLDERVLKKLSSNYGIPYTIDVLQAIEDVDAVIIATPTAEHFSFFKLCVGKVRNVFIEKPLADSYNVALEMQKLAKKYDIFVQCGFIERYNPVIKELKNIIQKESVIHFDFFRTNKHSSRIKDVDVILDLMIHDIDLALYLNGPIIDLSSHGNKQGNLLAFAMTTLTHKSGSFSRILASRVTEKKIRKIQVTTTKSFIEAELLSQRLSLHSQSKAQIIVNSDYKISAVESIIEVVRREPLLLELKSFIDNCSGNRSLEFPGLKASVEALRICEKIKNSVC